MKKDNYCTKFILTKTKIKIKENNTNNIIKEEKKRKNYNIYELDINVNIFSFNYELQLFLDKYNLINKSINNYNTIKVFPNSYFSNQDDYIKLLEKLIKLKKIIKINNYEKYLNKIDILLDHLNIKTVNIYIIFSLYLFFISKLLTKELYMDYAYILVVLIKFLNEKGWNKLLELKLIKDENYNFAKNNKINYCKNNDLKIFPYILEEFMNKYILNSFNDENIKNKNINLNIIDINKSNSRQIIIILMKFLAYWLYIFGFININCNFNVNS